MVLGWIFVERDGEHISSSGAIRGKPSISGGNFDVGWLIGIPLLFFLMLDGCSLKEMESIQAGFMRLVKEPVSFISQRSAVRDTFPLLKADWRKNSDPLTVKDNGTPFGWNLGL